MSDSMDDILHPGATATTEVGFPDAPDGWRRDLAELVAGAEGVTMSDDHWAVVRALQQYFARNEQVNVRELHDALNEAFHVKGGMKYLYRLLPRGPIAQGCRLAGLEPPAGAEDMGFGSVI